MASAEHPLVAAYRAHAAPHLIGQCLKTETVVGGGQCAGNGGVGSVRCLPRQEDVDGLFEAAFEQMFVAVEGNRALRDEIVFLGEVKAVQRVEEEKPTHALIEIFVNSTHLIERGALIHQRGQRRCTGEAFQRAVAHGSIVRGDDSDQLVHGDLVLVEGIGDW